MEHVIIGTAGHIDHGKTTLVKALTGRNTDRLKEEIDRGISIELGFTYFDLPSGKRAGIIDVPGHEKFIKNMLAGVIGIDIVLLVVASDEGIMPQTEEHLAILDILGIDEGAVVLTKTDLVDDEWLMLVEEDIKKVVEGTFLEDKEIFRISSTKKTGIENLIMYLDKVSNTLIERDIYDIPRLPIDRVFSISGFGTVVTGTLLSGKLQIGDEIQIFPTETNARIRNLEVHDNNVESAYAGQRVAINLAGIKKDEIQRGFVIAPPLAMHATNRLDVKVKLLKSLEKSIVDRTRVKLYIGTKEVLCRIILLDRDELKSGEESYAQLILEEEIVAKRGDRFILRFYSPMFTIGGGLILNPNAKKRKKYDNESINELILAEKGDSIDILEKIILKKNGEFPSIRELSKENSILEENMMKDITRLVDDGKISVYYTTKDNYAIHTNYLHEISDKILDMISKYHIDYPLRIGISKELLRNKILIKANSKVADQIIQNLIDKGKIRQKNDLLCLIDHNPILDDNSSKISDSIIKILEKGMFLPPKKEELYIELGCNKSQFEEVFNYLIANNDILKINEDLYLLNSSLINAKNLVIDYFKYNDWITIAEFRDLLGTNRKVALSLLEYFDQIKITVRSEDKRTLYDKHEVK